MKKNYHLTQSLDTDLIVMSYLGFMGCWSIAMINKGMCSNKCVQNRLNQIIGGILNGLQTHCNFKRNKNGRCSVTYAIYQITHGLGHPVRYKSNRPMCSNGCGNYRSYFDESRFHSIIFSKKRTDLVYRIGLMNRFYKLFNKQYEEVLNIWMRNKILCRAKRIMFFNILRSNGFQFFITPIKRHHETLRKEKALSGKKRKLNDHHLL